MVRKFPSNIKIFELPVVEFLGKSNPTVVVN
jgi:hypothetical protein